MDKNVTVEQIGEETVSLFFNNESMPEYFIQWWEQVGKESFEASIIDIEE